MNKDLDFEDIIEGEIYKIKDGAKCMNFQESSGSAYVKILEKTSSGRLSYDILNEKFDAISSCYLCIKPKDLEEIEGNKGKEFNLFRKGEYDTDNTDTTTTTSPGTEYINFILSPFLDEDKGENTNMLQKLTRTLKKALSKPLQTQYKAGFRNGDLALTERGTSALLELLADEYADALTKEAEAFIKDVEDEK